MKTESDRPGRRRRWIWWAIMVLTIMVLVLAVIDVIDAYYCRRRAQDVVDGAMLAGLSRLVMESREPAASEDRIVEDMIEFATRNGLTESDDLVGYYLDADGARLGTVGSGIPPDARGIEAVVQVRAATPLTRFLGLKGWPITRQASLVARSAAFPP